MGPPVPNSQCASPDVRGTGGGIDAGAGSGDVSAPAVAAAGTGSGPAGTAPMSAVEAGRGDAGCVIG